MNILVSGSTGFIGSAIIRSIEEAGLYAVRLVRRTPKKGEPVVRWDPDAGEIDSSGVGGVDAVVHLAGENIAEGRWTAEKKERILGSRTRGTRLLARTVAELPDPPKVFVCASAVGFYGNRGEEILDENSASGEGFLAGVCRKWEAACQPAADKGIRVVNTRFGVVLAAHGGVLPRVIPMFRSGLAGRLGSGKQYMSWVALEDVVGAIHHAIKTESLQGPVNVVSPNPVRNAEFTQAMAQAVGKKAPFAVPAFTLRLSMGEAADDIALASIRAIPRKLLETGYQFKYEKLEDALRDMVLVA
jgi:hypothetical protein